ncbi:MAG TPA: redoxin domain-containing protein [Methanomassiliicoccales archaeon]|jgi:peroxiredoxin Q/BCP
MAVVLGPPTGTKAPDFILPAGMDVSISLSELVRSKPALVLFYPSDFGMICSIEMKTFQNRLHQFALRCHLIGISTNTVRSHGDWSIGLGLQFPLLSDLDGRVSREWGLLIEDEGYMNGRAYRAAFLVDGKMIIRYRWVPEDPSYEPDYDALLAEVQRL